MAKVLVTGGCGFIGGHLVDALLAQKHQVTIIDDMSAGVKRWPEEVVPDIRIADIATLPVDGALGRFESRPRDWDVIFHTAAVSRTPPAVTNPMRCVDVNVNGTQRVLELARFLGVPRVVFSSSNVVYAGPTAYRMSKLAAEELCNVYTQMYGLSVVSLRYSNVYGSRLRKGDVAVFSLLRDTFLEKGYVEVTGDGEQTRDWTHVSDIVRGNLQAWKSEYTGILDLCTGINTKLVDAIRMMGAAQDVEIPVRRIGERAGDVKNIIQAPTLAKKILGWEAIIPLDKGIGDVWGC